MSIIPPRPDGAFEWRDVDGLPGLVCVPLADIAPHVFTTRTWQLGSRATDEGTAWDQIARALRLAPGDLVRARQVHGTTVARGRSVDGVLPEADILMAREPGLALAVQVADCVPILLADPATGAVAAVHAGWQGLAAGAPLTAVRSLSKEFGSRPSDIVAALGPSIGACCYQVGPDVREVFAAAGHRDALDAWFTVRPQAVPRNPPMPGLDDAERADRWFFDGWAAARAQLIEAGVPGEQVLSSALCTGSHPDHFCSFRRDGRGAGRLAAAIRT
ncbi:MAG: peptidoglycan editing factor PgeF [Vicinamibacterales bacterium]